MFNDNEKRPFEENGEQNFNEQGEKQGVESSQVNQAPQTEDFNANDSFAGGNGYFGGSNPPYDCEMNGFMPNEKGKYYALGITSMILGIVSVVCCCLFGAPIVLSITAIVFAVLRMNVKADGYAIAGLVTGIIGLLFNALMLVVAFSGGTVDPNELYELESMLESLEDAVKIFTLK